MTVEQGRFEWDSEKDELNIKRHGFSFSEILDVFDDPYFYEIYDVNHSSLGEERFIGIGNLNGLLIVTTVFTERTKTRLISSRRASPLEEKLYYEQQKQINS